MTRKTTLMLAGLLGLALVAGACASTGEQVEVTRIVEVTVEVEGEGETMIEQVQAPGYGEILARVQDRGRLVCGGRTDLLGFGYLDDDGRNIGIDIDLCRAVAAAVLGDPEAVEIVPITAAERGPAIQSGEIDLLTRNVTWTTSRDAQWGNFTVVMFYDGQGFMVPTASGVTELEQLDGATVCVTTGTTTELNLATSFRQLGMALEVVSFEDTASVYNAYEEGRCDATTSDKSQLLAVREGFADPSAHEILAVTISKEPLTPVVPHGDDQWLDLVKTVMWGLINAEWLDVTQANVGDMTSSDNLNVLKMLGVEGEFGQAELGLSATFMQDVLAAVGNYGEIYDRYLGPNGLAFTLERGPNAHWTDGGLIYAPPMK
ncbi:MAG: amino acid ABC transporter substrate-binding protein [Anaerolineales bacterium]